MAVSGSGYRVILADPPWEFRNKRSGGSMSSGAEAHYATLTTRQIAALEVERVAGRRAVLFLWVPGALLLEEGREVLQSWGFKYKACLVWRKTGRRGMGAWFRNGAEFLLLGVRGSVRAFRRAEESVFEAPVDRHSRKPAAAYELIEAATAGAAVRVEFFAREVRPGWVQTGLELDGRDIRSAVLELPAELEARERAAVLEELQARGPIGELAAEVSRALEASGFTGE